jgi:ATP-binding cassette subfamily B protein
MTPAPRRRSSAEEPDLTWRARIESLRNVGPLLRLVWDTSPTLVSVSIFLRLLRGLMPLALLWVPKLILDEVVARIAHHGRSPETIWKLVALEFGLAALGDLLSRSNTLCDSILGDRFTNRISLRIMEHATRLDLASFEDPVFNDKLERARRQTTGRLGLLASILGVFQNTASLVALSAGFIVYSPWLMALLAAAVIPSFLGETHFSQLAYSVLFRRTPQRRLLEYLRYLGASVQSAKEIKIFGLGPYLTERYQTQAVEMQEENRKLATKRASVGFGLNLISTAGYYGAYVVVLGQTLAGALSLGTFTFLTGAFSRSRSAIEQVLSSFQDISDEALYVKDLFDFFELEPSIKSVEHALVAPRPIRQGFEFRDVAFGYPGSERMVVRGLNFRLDAGEKIALIGENGAGKTTIVKLLARLYDPVAGSILLDGVDLREYSVEDLRREIGVIFQDYMRYDMIARDNIAFGKIESRDDTAGIQQAAYKSLADTVIKRLDGGYDQMLGRRFEGGADLSGGEWQKFALARAYMRDAQLLILDEPTATLDARAEFEVFERFADLTRDRMAVLISHRFSTVRMADRILVLDGGEIKEQGSHSQLVALGGQYAQLFELQASGYR